MAESALLTNLQSGAVLAIVGQATADPDNSLLNSLKGFRLNAFLINENPATVALDSIAVEAD